MMSDQCLIDCDGKHYYLRIPNTKGRYHTVMIPVDRPAALANILIQRNKILNRPQRDRHAGNLGIGSEANPTQSMIDAFLASNEARVDVRAEQERLEALARRAEKYEIDVDTLDLDI